MRATISPLGLGLLVALLTGCTGSPEDTAKARKAGTTGNGGGANAIAADTLEIARLRDDLAKKDARIRDLEVQLTLKDQRIRELEGGGPIKSASAIKSLEYETSNQETRLRQVEAEIPALETRLRDLEQQVAPKPPLPNLNGVWFVNNLRTPSNETRIIQAGDRLTLINERKEAALANFDATRQYVIVPRWNLRGLVVGNEIFWRRGSEPDSTEPLFRWVR
jgi:hypothetical protein